MACIDDIQVFLMCVDVSDMSLVICVERAIPAWVYFAYRIVVCVPVDVNSTGSVDGMRLNVW